MRVCPSCFAQEKSDANFCGLCGTQLVEIQGAAEKSFVGMTLNDKYVIKSLIARGGMGEVYLAEHEGLGQKVAVKFLSQRFTSDPKVVVRFVNEARSYCLVSHPRAVTLHDFGQLPDGTLFIIMEYVRGQNLAEHMQLSGPLPHKTVLQLGSQLADVLLAAHAQGVIHRDLKPDNVMVLEPTPGRYQVKVLDFGIAKILDADHNEGQLTEAGMIFGTPEFMSPEQARGDEDLDHRADIYAFGMLLYYMLTEQLPFEDDNKLSVLQSQLHDEPDRPSARAPDLDIHPHLEAVILTCLEKERDDRYPDFSALLADLEHILHGEPPELVESNLFLMEDDPPRVPPTEIELVPEPEPEPAPTPPVNDDPPLVLATPKPRVDPLEAAYEAAPASDVLDISDVFDDDDFDPPSLLIIPEDEEPPLIIAEPKNLSADDDTFILGDDDDDDTFIVSDDGFDIGPPTRRSSSGGGAGLIVFLLLIAGGVAAFVVLGSDDATEPAPSEPAAEATDAPPTDDAQPDASEEPASDATSTAPTPRAEPPSALGARYAEAAAARALLDRAQARFDDQDFDDAAPLARYVKDTYTGQPKPVLERAKRIADTAKEASELLERGAKYAERERCARAEDYARELRAISPDAADDLDRKVRRCKRAFGAAPDEVD